MRTQLTTDPTMQHPYLAAEYRQIRASFDDEVIVRTASIERDAAYLAALELVRRIDANLDSGRGNYWRRDGKLLMTLGEVVEAVLGDDLLC